MRRVGIVGCGVVGAAIAYTLSQTRTRKVTIWDQRSPDQWAATGAALGVLMAAISPRLRGQHLRMRLESLQRYETLIPELERLTGLTIPWNRQGILQLCFDQTELERWPAIQAVRQQQGFRLEIWDREQVIERYPDLASAHQLETRSPLVGAVYSPQDRQIDPVALTRALIAGARHYGTTIEFQSVIAQFQLQAQGEQQRLSAVCTPQGEVPVAGLVIAAGLGSFPLTKQLRHPIPLQPVLGQALKLRRTSTSLEPRPVVHGNGIHLVPLPGQELWVGATVEFPAESSQETPRPDPAQLEQVRQQAIALCPDLAKAEVLDKWSGLRPRPSDRRAPVIEKLPGYTNVIVATGHYRNGILLAPATAESVRQWLMELT